ncbi:MAG: hypothetical protein LQ349_003441 [Xanthoria aureola]|nr:MAG: hypothetical protein LQ349_003441 [Xanthoria aureola]
MTQMPPTLLAFAVRKSWFKEPPKKSWWSEPPKKPSRAAQFIENLVIGAVCIGSIGYCLTLSAVTDRLKAEMKNLDIFGVEKLRDDLEKHIRTSQKPNEAIDHDDCLPSASKMDSASASGRGQPPDSNLPSPETHSSLLLAAAQAQDAETQQAERMRLTRARIPSPNSEDPEEQLAAYWKDPKNKPELSEWWDRELEVTREEKGMVYE